MSAPESISMSTILPTALLVENKTIRTVAIITRLGTVVPKKSAKVNGLLGTIETTQVARGILKLSFTKESSPTFAPSQLKSRPKPQVEKAFIPQDRISRSTTPPTASHVLMRKTKNNARTTKFVIVVCKKSARRGGPSGLISMIPMMDTTKNLSMNIDSMAGYAKGQLILRPKQQVGY